MEELAEQLIRTCQTFLTQDCGRVDPTGIADPWLDYEESYKRAHSYVVRRDIGWSPETSYEPVDLAAQNHDYQYARVREAYLQRGFTPNRFGKRLLEINSYEPFEAFAGKGSREELSHEVGRAARDLGAAYDDVDRCAQGAARLERLLRSGREKAAGTLYRRVLTGTNLVTWSNWPPFSTELAHELVEFVNANQDGLHQGAFERFVKFLATQPSPERSKKMTLRPAAVRSVTTFWLMTVNPSAYIYLKRDEFGRALSQDYPEHGGRLVSYDDYAAVLDGCQRFSEELRSYDPRWAPRDLIDVQTLLWLGLRRGWKPPKGTKTATGRPGAPYRRATVTETVGTATPSIVDAETVERGLQGHVDTQNALADFLNGEGITPLSPKSGDPEFDIAWRSGGVFFVGEVKSTTEVNMEKQLRLGLGQVLRYRQQLAGRAKVVQAVLIAELEPEPSWVELCKSLDVVLVWPAAFELLVGATIPA